MSNMWMMNDDQPFLWNSKQNVTHKLTNEFSVVILSDCRQCPFFAIHIIPILFKSSHWLCEKSLASFHSQRIKRMQATSQCSCLSIPVCEENVSVFQHFLVHISNYNIIKFSAVFIKMSFVLLPYYTSKSECVQNLAIRVWKSTDAQLSRGKI